MIGKGKTESMRDKIRHRAESRRNLGGLTTLELPEGVELYKPEKGSVEFDILPYVVSVDNHPEVKKGEQWYQRNYLAHRNVGPEEKFLICPRTIGKRCPICEEHQKLKRDPNAEEEVVDALRAKERELFNVVMKDGDGSVMILDISTFLFGRKLEEEIREGDEANAAFAELSGGKTLKVRWESKNMGTNKFATPESTYDVEDLAVGFVRYAGGLSLELEFSWASNTAQEYTFIELYGTKGGLKYEKGQLTLFEDFEGTIIDATPKLKNDGAWGNTETRHLVDCILNDREVLSKPEEAVKIMQIIQGIYRSAETGGEVRVG